MLKLLKAVIFLITFGVFGSLVEIILRRMIESWLSSVRWIIRKSRPALRVMPIVDGLNTPKTTTYNYAGLEGQENIRILVLNPGRDVDEVSCHLSCVSLLGKPKYEALSYVWGDTNNMRTIMCSDGTVQITVSLYSALWHLRYHDHQRILWADGLCINQKDIEERTQQVRVMAKIYSYAEQVLVWLGGETEQVRDSFEAILQAWSLFPPFMTVSR